MAVHIRTKVTCSYAGGPGVVIPDDLVVEADDLKYLKLRPSSPATGLCICTEKMQPNL